MKQIENTNIYRAAEGCFIIRKADGFIMGEDIDLGSADSIDNYEEKPYTQEEYDDFCKTYGIKVPKDITNKVNNNNNKYEQDYIKGFKR